jgi:hypothetical protein
MKRIAFGLGTVAAFIGVAAMVVWLQGGLTPSQKGKAATHLHCPECGLEVSYKADLEGKWCPQCGAGGPKMIATVGPYKGQRKAETGPAGRILVGVLVALVVVPAGLYVWVLYSQARQRAEEEARNQFLVCHCPFCARKIGYPMKKVGEGSLCPRCKTAFTLPEGEVLDEV